MMSKPRSLLFALLLSLSSSAFAQVYQSTDEQGNPSFSDTPSAGSTEIKIPETNTGDAVKVPPPEPKPAPVPEVAVEKSAPPEVVEGDYNNGGGYRKRRHHRRYGHGR